MSTNPSPGVATATDPIAGAFEPDETTTVDPDHAEAGGDHDVDETADVDPDHAEAGGDHGLPGGS